MDPQMIMRMLGSSNPELMIEQIAQRNPIMQRALQMTKGKSADECEKIVRNIARQRGMNDEQFKYFVSQFGFRL